MPRGYLKRNAKHVGRKAARGGSSKNVGYQGCNCYWCNPKGSYSRRSGLANLSAVAEDCLEDYEMAQLDMLCEFYDENDEYEQNVYEGKQEAVAFDATSVRREIIEQDANLSFTSEVVRQAEDKCSFTSEMVHKAQEEMNDESSYSLCGDVDDRSLLSAFSLVSVQTAGVAAQSVEKEQDEDSFSAVSASTWNMVDVKKPFLEEDSSSTCTSAEQPQYAQEEELAVAEEAKVSTEAPQQPFTKCAICLEDTPTMQLLNKCRHPRACFQCLRIHYVSNAMQDPNNYPLTCFWPGCDRTLHSLQMRELTRNSAEEMDVFFQNQATAKNNRRQAKEEELRMAYLAQLPGIRLHNLRTLQYCSNCSVGTAVYPCRPARVVACRSCRQVNPIDCMSRADARCIVEAAGDYLVNCPQCSRLIIKDGGCNHMTCVCSHEFSFDKAKVAMDGGRAWWDNV